VKRGISTNITDGHDITKILFTVALDTLTPYDAISSAIKKSGCIRRNASLHSGTI
jgi:hypothetical protein